MNLSRSVARAAMGALDAVMSRAALRGATRVGSGVRVFGWPVVGNEGELTIGNEVAFVSTPSAIELLVAPGGSLVIGARTLIESGASVRARGIVRIGHGVRIGAGCIVDGDGPGVHAIVIGDGAWLENGAVLLGGVRVAAGAFVAGGGAAGTGAHDSSREPQAARSNGASSDALYIADVQRRLRAALSRVVPGISNIDIGNELTLVKGWDSLAALRALVALEKEFAVVLPTNLFADHPSLETVTPVVATAVARHGSVR